jgi:hypothetical protein
LVRSALKQREKQEQKMQQQNKMQQHHQSGRAGLRKASIGAGMDAVLKGMANTAEGGGSSGGDGGHSSSSVGSRQPLDVDFMHRVHQGLELPPQSTSPKGGNNDDGTEGGNEFNQQMAILFDPLQVVDEDEDIADLAMYIGGRAKRRRNKKESEGEHGEAEGKARDDDEPEDEDDPEAVKVAKHGLGAASAEGGATLDDGDGDHSENCNGIAPPRLWLRSYYLLRCTRIRQLWLRLRSSINYFHSVQRELTLEAIEHAKQCPSPTVPSPTASMRSGSDVVVIESDSSAAGPDESGPVWLLYGPGVNTTSCSPARAHPHPDHSRSRTGSEPAVPIGLGAHGREHMDNGVGNAADFVADAHGVRVMYEGAEEGCEATMREMLAIGSHYIAQVEHQTKGQHAGSSVGANAGAGVGEGRVLVDRAEVLLELLACEVRLAERKRALVLRLLEARAHTLGTPERASFAQHVVDTIARRPQLELGSGDLYFVEAYELGCEAVEMEARLFARVVSEQIWAERALAERVHTHSALRSTGGAFDATAAGGSSNDGDASGVDDDGNDDLSVREYGHPDAPCNSEHNGEPLLVCPVGHGASTLVSAKPKSRWQLAHAKSSRKDGGNGGAGISPGCVLVGVLDVYPSVGAVSRLPSLLERAEEELSALIRPASATERLVLKQLVIDAAAAEWRALTDARQRLSHPQPMHCQPSSATFGGASKEEIGGPLQPLVAGIQQTGISPLGASEEHGGQSIHLLEAAVTSAALKAEVATAAAAAAATSIMQEQAGKPMASQETEDSGGGAWVEANVNLGTKSSLKRGLPKRHTIGASKLQLAQMAAAAAAHKAQSLKTAGSSAGQQQHQQNEYQRQQQQQRQRARIRAHRLKATCAAVELQQLRKGLSDETHETLILQAVHKYHTSLIGFSAPSQSQGGTGSSSAAMMMHRTASAYSMPAVEMAAQASPTKKEKAAGTRKSSTVQEKQANDAAQEEGLFKLISHAVTPSSALRVTTALSPSDTQVGDGAASALAIGALDASLGKIELRSIGNVEQALQEAVEEMVLNECLQNPQHAGGTSATGGAGSGAKANTGTNTGEESLDDESSSDSSSSSEDEEVVVVENAADLDSPALKPPVKTQKAKKKPSAPTLVPPRRQRPFHFHFRHALHSRRRQQLSDGGNAKVCLLRMAVQVQVAERALLTTAVTYHQMLIDPLLRFESLYDGLVHADAAAELSAKRRMMHSAGGNIAREFRASYCLSKGIQTASRHFLDIDGIRSREHARVVIELKPAIAYLLSIGSVSTGERQQQPGGTSSAGPSSANHKQKLQRRASATASTMMLSPRRSVGTRPTLGVNDGGEGLNDGGDDDLEAEANAGVTSTGSSGSGAKAARMRHRALPSLVAGYCRRLLQGEGTTATSARRDSARGASGESTVASGSARVTALVLQCVPLLRTLRQTAYCIESAGDPAKGLSPFKVVPNPAVHAVHETADDLVEEQHAAAAVATPRAAEATPRASFGEGGSAKEQDAERQRAGVQARRRQQRRRRLFVLGFEEWLELELHEVGKQLRLIEHGHDRRGQGQDDDRATDDETDEEEDDDEDEEEVDGDDKDGGGMMAEDEDKLGQLSLYANSSGDKRTSSKSPARVNMMAMGIRDSAVVIRSAVSSIRMMSATVSQRYKAAASPFGHLIRVDGTIRDLWWLPHESELLGLPVEARSAGWSEGVLEERLTTLLHLWRPMAELLQLLQLRCSLSPNRHHSHPLQPSDLSSSSGATTSVFRGQGSAPGKGQGMRRENNTSLSSSASAKAARRHKNNSAAVADASPADVLSAAITLLAPSSVLLESVSLPQSAGAIVARPIHWPRLCGLIYPWEAGDANARTSSDGSDGDAANAAEWSALHPRHHFHPGAGVLSMQPSSVCRHRRGQPLRGSPTSSGSGHWYGGVMASPVDTDVHLLAYELHELAAEVLPPPAWTMRRRGADGADDDDDEEVEGDGTAAAAAMARERSRARARARARAGGDHDRIPAESVVQLLWAKRASMHHSTCALLVSLAGTIRDRRAVAHAAGKPNKSDGSSAFNTPSLFSALSREDPKVRTAVGTSDDILRLLEAAMHLEGTNSSSTPSSAAPWASASALPTSSPAGLRCYYGPAPADANGFVDYMQREQQGTLQMVPAMRPIPLPGGGVGRPRLLLSSLQRPERPAPPTGWLREETSTVGPGVASVGADGGWASFSLRLRDPHLDWATDIRPGAAERSSYVVNSEAAASDRELQTKAALELTGSLAALDGAGSDARIGVMGTGIGAGGVGISTAEGSTEFDATRARGMTVDVEAGAAAGGAADRASQMLRGWATCNIGGDDVSACAHMLPVTPATYVSTPACDDGSGSGCYYPASPVGCDVGLTGGGLARAALQPFGIGGGVGGGFYRRAIEALGGLGHDARVIGYEAVADSQVAAAGLRKALLFKDVDAQAEQEANAAKEPATPVSPSKKRKGAAAKASSKDADSWHCRERLVELSLLRPEEMGRLMRELHEREKLRRKREARAKTVRYERTQARKEKEMRRLEQGSVDDDDEDDDEDEEQEDEEDEECQRSLRHFDSAERIVRGEHAKLRRRPLTPVERLIATVVECRFVLLGRRAAALKEAYLGDLRTSITQQKPLQRQPGQHQTVLPYLQYGPVAMAAAAAASTLASSPGARTHDVTVDRERLLAHAQQYELDRQVMLQYEQRVLSTVSSAIHERLEAKAAADNESRRAKQKAKAEAEEGDRRFMQRKLQADSFNEVAYKSKGALSPSNADRRLKKQEEDIGVGSTALLRRVKMALIKKAKSTIGGKLRALGVLQAQGERRARVLKGEGSYEGRVVELCVLVGALRGRLLRDDVDSTEGALLVLKGHEVRRQRRHATHIVTAAPHTPGLIGAEAGVEGAESGEVVAAVAEVNAATERLAKAWGFSPGTIHSSEEEVCGDALLCAFMTALRSHSRTHTATPNTATRASKSTSAAASAHRRLHSTGTNTAAPTTPTVVVEIEQATLETLLRQLTVALSGRRRELNGDIGSGRIDNSVGGEQVGEEAHLLRLLQRSEADRSALSRQLVEHADGVGLAVLAEFTRRGFSLLHSLESRRQQLRGCRQELAEQRAAVEAEVRQDYADLLRDLLMSLTSCRADAEAFKLRTVQQMAVKLGAARNEALLQAVVERGGGSLEARRHALRSIQAEEEKTALRGEATELRSTLVAQDSMYKQREVAIRAELTARLNGLQRLVRGRERLEAEQAVAGGVAAAHRRGLQEARQQLAAERQKSRGLEREVEQARALRAGLKSWKAKTAEVREELEKRVQELHHQLAMAKHSAQQQRRKQQQATKPFPGAKPFPSYDKGVATDAAPDERPQSSHALSQLPHAQLAQRLTEETSLKRRAFDKVDELRAELVRVKDTHGQQLQAVRLEAQEAAAEAGLRGVAPTSELVRQWQRKQAATERQVQAAVEQMSKVEEENQAMRALLLQFGVAAPVRQVTTGFAIPAVGPVGAADNGTTHDSLAAASDDPTADGGPVGLLPEHEAVLYANGPEVMAHAPTRAHGAMFTTGPIVKNIGGGFSGINLPAPKPRPAPIAEQKQRRAKSASAQQSSVAIKPQHLSLGSGLGPIGNADAGRRLPQRGGAGAMIWEKKRPATAAAGNSRNTGDGGEGNSTVFGHGYQDPKRPSTTARTAASARPSTARSFKCRPREEPQMGLIATRAKPVARPSTATAKPK